MLRFQDGDLLHAVLGQAYFGSASNLTAQMSEQLASLFASEEVLRKGLFTDMMYSKTTSKEEARTMPEIEKWKDNAEFDFVKEAGW